MTVLSDLFFDLMCLLSVPFILLEELLSLFGGQL